MRVSFDIDDTLVCGPTVPAETVVSRWNRRRYAEPLRRGARGLMHDLRARDCRIWLYTSSRRSERYLSGWFNAVGVPIEGIVNLGRHEQVVGIRGPSKYPPAFGIGLHIDDSHGVAMEGTAHGFRVLVLSPHDEQWTDRVLQTVDSMRGLRATHQ